MDIRQYIEQYKNPELCAKFNNNIPASELEFPFVFMTDSQNIEALCEAFTFLPRQNITGALVTVMDGDYGEVYITESSNPYMDRATYHPLDYYLEV